MFIAKNKVFHVEAPLLSSGFRDSMFNAIESSVALIKDRVTIHPAISLCIAVRNPIEFAKKLSINAEKELGNVKSWQNFRIRDMPVLKFPIIEENSFALIAAGTSIRFSPLAVCFTQLGTEVIDDDEDTLIELTEFRFFPED